MVHVAVSDLKSTLSEQLRRVKAGEEVTVTERGIPIARIIPYPPTPAGAEDIFDLVAQGVVRLPTRPLPANFFADPGPPTGVLQALLADREEGW